jgi:hypothetical protein
MPKKQYHHPPVLPNVMQLHLTLAYADERHDLSANLDFREADVVRLPLW